MKKITILAAVVALLGSCAQNTEDTINPNTKAEGRTIYATFDNEEEETKTYVENYKYLRWHAGDEISFFDATTHNSQYVFAGNDGDAEGEFNAVATGEGTAIATTYGVYPYNANTSIIEEGIISVWLPAIQAYGVNSFGKGANTMVAVGESATDDKLFFKNACGYLVVKLYNENGATVKSVFLKGNDKEEIAGNAQISATYADVPSVKMAYIPTYTSVTIDCGEGVEIGTTAETATEFWFALPEITFEGGITITATATEGVFEKMTTKPVTITRNDVQPMKALEAEFVVPTETWKINYTSTEKIKPYKTGEDIFGANIISNEWDETTGGGVITFDGEVTMIGDMAFYAATSLKSISIPESVTEIGESALKHTAIRDITLPENLERIEDQAFYYCTALTSITIPESVVYIGTGAFSHCPNLTAFYGKYASEDNRCLINDNRAAYGEICLTAFAPKGVTEYAIPDGVTIIDDYVFEDAENLEYVIIPNSVKIIGDSAFSGCRYLKSVVIGSGVTRIEDRAFHYTNFLECICLKSTTPPRVRDIFESSFYGEPVIYVPIESVDDYKANSEWSDMIADYNIEIEGSHFATTSEIHYTSNDGNIVEPCEELIGAKIISNTYKDGKGVIELFGYVMKLATYTFKNCSNLTSISLPSSVTSLENMVFQECPNLTSAIIPECVNFMGSYTFDECMNINEIYFKAQNPPILNHPVFFDNGLTPRIYVPSDSVSAYKNAENWTYWADLIVGYNFE